jgi:hypothetical protein
VGGYNRLEPDRDQVQAGAYEVNYFLLEMRYTIDDFRRMIFANVKFDDSKQTDGSAAGNVLTIGMQWDLSKRGWHKPNP